MDFGAPKCRIVNRALTRSYDAVLLRRIKYFLEGSNYFMDAFSRNKQIPKIGTIIFDEILSLKGGRFRARSTFKGGRAFFFLIVLVSEH